SRRRHTRFDCDWSSDVCSSDLAQGLAGKVPVSGQDGDKAALNRVALGTQTVDVWKDARLLGKTAGDAAIQLCKNSDPSKVTGTRSKERRVGKECRAGRGAE